MPKIRVMVVDDAVVVRKLLAEALSNHPEIEVVATAANGKLALAKIPVVNPDLIILDVEMPELDGLATLSELRKTWRDLPVIMFSSHTQAGAATTLEALQRGANDFVAKPTGMSSIAQSIEQVREQLISRIKVFCHHLRDHSTVVRPAIRIPPTLPTHGQAVIPTVTAPVVRVPRGRIEIVVIGVSTGGPNALAEMIPLLPKGLPVPVLIVQHMPPVFTRMLAERLSLKAQLPVAEGVQGQILLPGHIHLAPGDWHMLVERNEGNLRLKLNQAPPENSCRPAVDPLFRSAAEVCGPNVLAVVMTGMGQDGTRGAQVLHELGAKVIVQDEATSVVWGMPGAVVRAGIADQVLPLGQLAAEISRRVLNGRIL